MRDFNLSLAVLLLTTILGVRAAAQPGTRVPGDVATKVDDYGDLRSCDHSARLDNFAIRVQENDGSQALIFAYGPEGEGFDKGTPLLNRIRDYLVNSRGIPTDRIRTVYAGRNDVLSQPRVQLWFVPAGVPPPKPQKFKVNLETFHGLFAEDEAYDHGDFEREEDDLADIGEDEGTGPPVGGVTYFSLVDLLKHQKTGVVYVVAYNGEDTAPGAWRRIAEGDVARLKKLGVEAKRIKVIFGGASKKSKVQLWVAPADAPPPVIDAGAEPPPAKTVELFSFDDEELADTKLERSSIKRLVDTLRQFPTLQACLIVRFGTYVEPPAEPEMETVPSEIETSPIEEVSSEQPLVIAPERPPADVAVLVEKWRAELAETYKISSDRFVVLFTQSDSFVNNRLDAWVVPPGAPLPKLDEEEEEALPNIIQN